MLGSRLSCFTECYSWTNIFVVPQAVEALVDASTWPGHGLNVGSAEDAQGKQEKRRLVELFQRSGGQCTACAPWSAILSAPAARGGRGSGLLRFWRVSEVQRTCKRRGYVRYISVTVILFSFVFGLSAAATRLTKKLTNLLQPGPQRRASLSLLQTCEKKKLKLTKVGCARMASDVCASLVAHWRSCRSPRRAASLTTRVAADSRSG